MSQDLVPYETEEEMWTLAPDRRTVRLSVPPVRMSGLREPIRIFVDFDAEGVEDVLRRLIVLRARMADLERPQTRAPGSNGHDKALQAEIDEDIGGERQR